MFYTVIQKSGWQTDSWRVAKTFPYKGEAQRYAESHRQADPREGFYHTAVKAHKKPLVKLAEQRTDLQTVKFSDGTVATW